MTLLVGCGGSSLQEGDYSVSLALSSDTCGGAQSSTTTWHILEADDAWTMTPDDNSTAMTGNESGDTIVFAKPTTATINNCVIDESITATIRPNGDNFTGTLSLHVYAECDRTTCDIVFDVTGKKK
jgi:hypothetical protein